MGHSSNIGPCQLQRQRLLNKLIPLLRHRKDQVSLVRWQAQQLALPSGPQSATLSAVLLLLLSNKRSNLLMPMHIPEMRWTIDCTAKAHPPTPPDLVPPTSKASPIA